MGSTLYKNDPDIVIEYMKSYLKSKPPDCTLFSKDGFEIPVHKELIHISNQAHSSNYQKWH